MTPLRLILIICLLLSNGGATRGKERNAAATENASATEAARGVRQIIGHRGSTADRPENTLAAIRRAIEIGATAAEIDVRSTADGRLVLLHDATLDRTTDGSGPVAKKELAEVQKLDAGSRFDPRFRRERVPTLEDALALCRDRIDVVLDLKEQGEDYDRAVAETVRAAGDPRSVIVGVRSVEQAKRFRKLLPESRQLAFIPGTEAIEAFAEAGCETIRLWPKWLDQQRKEGRRESDPVRRVREAGAMLHLNVASGEREEVLRLLEHRPDSLLADDPGKLVTMLQQLQAAAAVDVGVALPHGWDAKEAGDRVLRRLVVVTAPEVKGAHDAEMVLVGDRAYIVAEVNDVSAGESADRPEIFSAMSIVDLARLEVERIIPIARSEQSFANVTLPVGACFVPRIIQKDDTTLRCYFASEQPGVRQSQMWYRDFDLKYGQFEDEIHRAKLKTAAGVFDMQPQHFHADAVAHGFRKPAKDFGLYLFDSFKNFDGKTYVAINNFPGKQNALALVHDDLATFEVLGHYNEPQELELSESAVNRLPDGTWTAICRQDGGDFNYTFSTSRDGRIWTRGEHRDFVSGGSNSKPTFDRFGDVYYLGWQEHTRIDRVRRSVFNIDVSPDGETWTRKYRFETPQSFQYPTFREHAGAIWLCVTQGDSSPSRKERIMFGKLEDLER